MTKNIKIIFQRRRIVKDFTESHLVWTGVINGELIAEEQPDVVIYELAERSVFSILSSIPPEYVF